uniref:DNA polymerase n=1 Tax=Urostyla grandis TaxID=57509 RepID=Q8I944_9SPIT|nr:type I DNA polymerase alpha [Urostyla grandis]
MSKQTTSSGRVIKKVSDKKQDALAQFKAAREGKEKRTEQYKGDEHKKIFEEIDAEEYDALYDQRENDDFIVDDDGIGYKEKGGEIWDYEESDDDYSNKEKKVKSKKKKQEGGDIAAFMFPTQGLNKRKGGNTGVQGIKKQGKVNEAQSKDLLNELMDDFDNKPIDELEDIHTAHQALNVDDSNFALSKEQQMMNKYNVIIQPQATTNIVVQEQKQIEVKKRSLEEMRQSNSTIKNNGHNESRVSDQNKTQQAMNNTSYQTALDHSVVQQIDQVEQEKMAIDEEWQLIKEQNEQMKVMTAASSESVDSYPLPVNKDKELAFFWFDAHEENMGLDVFLFGKVYQPELKQYVSCSLKVNGMQRIVYALPKVSKNKSRAELTKEEEQEMALKIFSELDGIRKNKFPSISQWKCKVAKRKYAFEMPIHHGEHQLLKIKYDSTMPPLPANLTGSTFECLFNTQQSMLELLLLKQKIKGPCWITLKNVQQITQASNKRSWCKHDLVISSPKDIVITVDDLNKESPPLTALCLALKTCRSAQNTNEISMISMLIHNNINQDGATNDKRMQSITLIRRLNTAPLPKDFEGRAKQKKDSSIFTFQNEKALLENFISRLHLIDPDMLIAHNLCGGILELLLARIQWLKLAHWSRLGRLKRQQIPTKKFDSVSQQWVPRLASCGRLLVDTFLSAKELIRETSYDLKHLADVQLKKVREDYDDDLINSFYVTSERLFKLIEHTERDSYLTFSLMQHLSVVPLTKQLTSIAGNLWYRSLQNARAERNEMLLLHEFYGKKYLCPDKAPFSKDKKQFEDYENENLFGNEEVKGNNKKRKKAQYSGGLVIEPKAGFYDTIILLLDFNSLYPSIIQEYNLCFTTVNRRPSKNYDNSDIKSKQDENIDDEVELPDKGNTYKDAILPNVLKNLVQKRKIVKEQLKKETDPVKQQQLEIRQKAIKLTANSMYGCLGFSSSRFHAKAIAALITKTGRETLLKTKDIAENKLGFNVVYGDTDSIMINSGTTNIEEALKMGHRLKQEVNQHYKCLEIEIDGLFKSLLLLKKKKYAALKVENFMSPDRKTIIKECKGLDMVRRDWCALAKNAGDFVLDQILSGQQREDIVLTLTEHLSNLGQRMKNNQIPLKEYVINKQITRALSEYHDTKALPHVAVALRLKNQGKSEADLNFIPYVICTEQDKKSQFLSEKAYHPDEVLTSKGKIQLDVDWYITQQILPIISRLIEHIEGIEADFIAQCFGIDPKKYKYTSSIQKSNDINDDTAHIKKAILSEETENKLKQRSIAYLKVVCFSCHLEQEFPGVFQKNGTISGLVCQKPDCGVKFSDQYIQNRVTLFMKQLLNLYYEGKAYYNIYILAFC